MAECPAARAGPRIQASIAVGDDADLAASAPAESAVVDDPAELNHKNAVTPNAGRALAGRVRRTMRRGIDISADVETNGDRHGRLLRRGEA